MTTDEKLIALYRIEYLDANPGATEAQFQADLPEYKRRRLSATGLSAVDRQRVLDEPRANWSTASSAGSKVVDLDAARRKRSWGMSPDRTGGNS